eukprot:gene12176-biopygen895
MAAWQRNGHKDNLVADPASFLICLGVLGVLSGGIVGGALIAASGLMARGGSFSSSAPMSQPLLPTSQPVYQSSATPRGW